MKSFSILAIFLSAFALNFCFAEEETSDVPVTPIKEIELKTIDFERLSKESKVGNLSEFVKGEENITDLFTERAKSRLILYPYTETLAYVNGQLCHIGNYARSVIYTVLEGPYYGMQTTVTYDGVVLYVNYDFVAESTPGGIVFYHYYSDSKVITGANQVIKF